MREWSRRHSWGISPKLSRDSWRWKREKKSENRGGQNEKVQSTDVGEAGRQTYPNTERSGISRNWRSRAAEKTRASKWAVRLLEHRADSNAPSAEELEQRSLSLRILLAFLRVCAAPEDTGSATCCESHSSAAFTRKTWLCFSHFHSASPPQRTKRASEQTRNVPCSRRWGRSCHYRVSVSMTCSVSGPPHSTESEHQFLQAVRGFCLQSVIWEMLMECPSLLASHP